MRSSTLLVAFTCFGLMASAQAPMAPVPADPHELATGAVQVPSTPADRAAVMALLERAKQNSDMHMPGTPPFSVKVAFNASGSVSSTGPGEISELWMSGRQWRYDQSLASYSETRIGNQGQMFATPVSAVPLRVHTLRNAMFWPVGGNPSNSAIRTAATQWNGKPVTCVLLSGGAPEPGTGRRWEETEYCVDNASGLLEIFSRAPGTYVVYSYAKNLQFHGRTVPDQISIFTGGAQVLEAQVTIGDAGTPDANSLKPSAEMTPALPSGAVRFPMQLASPLSEGALVRPVIVHAMIDGNGKISEVEISASSDPSLNESALEAVKKSAFGNQLREAYINVRFVPGS